MFRFEIGTVKYECLNSRASTITRCYDDNDGDDDGDCNDDNNNNKMFIVSVVRKTFRHNIHYNIHYFVRDASPSLPQCTPTHESRIIGISFIIDYSCPSFNTSITSIDAY